MLFIGVTGAIGSGKTHITQYYHTVYHDKIFNADDYVKSLYKKKHIQSEICNAIPEIEIFSISKLRSAVASNPLYLKILEKIIHSHVKSAILKFKSKNSNSSGLCFVELPLLFEAGYKHIFDRIIAVFTTRSKRLLRIKKRKSFEYKMYQQMEKRQISPYKKAENADYIVYNSGSKLDLIFNLKKLRHVLLSDET